MSRQLAMALYASMLSALSQNCFAETETHKFDNAETAIVKQSELILKSFESFGVRTQGEPYLTLWIEEFAAADQIDIFTNAVHLAQGNVIVDGAPNGHLYIIASKTSQGCDMHLSNFNGAKRRHNLPPAVLKQLDIQSLNISSACALIRDFFKLRKMN